LSARWCRRKGGGADRGRLIADREIYAADLGKGKGGRIGTDGVLIYTAHDHGGSAGEGQMELATARAGAGGRTVTLIGVLAVTCFIGGERATVVAGILILHTGLIGHDGIPGGIEGLAVQEGVEGGGTGPCQSGGCQSQH